MRARYLPATTSPWAPRSARVSLMSCICDKLGAGHPGLSSTCLADLWLFQHLEPSDLSALLDAAWRSQYETGAVFATSLVRATRGFPAPALPIFGFSSTWSHPTSPPCSTPPGVPSTRQERSYSYKTSGQTRCS